MRRLTWPIQLFAETWVGLWGFVLIAAIGRLEVKAPLLDVVLENTKRNLPLALVPIYFGVCVFLFVFLLWWSSLPKEK